jgi:hypothetical protein
MLAAGVACSTTIPAQVVSDIVSPMEASSEPSSTLTV